MAQKPARPCQKPGCSALTREGFCPLHAPEPKSHRRRSSQDYHRLYGLRAWKRELRPAQLLRAPFCQSCLQNGKRTAATVVDHLRPHRGKLSVFLDPANLQSLCKRCHDRKTAGEQAALRQGRTD